MLNITPMHISESNLIDKQYSYVGNLIPGAKPGDKMYDNHLNAFNCALETFMDPKSPLKVHRELTNGIDTFELVDMSGQYRKCNIRIGNRLGDPPFILAKRIEEDWHFVIQKLMNEKDNFDKQTQKELAFESHAFFEMVHPFIDGNGRTGRCLLWALEVNLGFEPTLFLEKDKMGYFIGIENWVSKFKIRNMIKEKLKNYGD